MEKIHENICKHVFMLYLCHVLLFFLLIYHMHV